MNDHVSALEAFYYSLTIIAFCTSMGALFGARRGPQGQQGPPGKDAEPAEVHINLEMDTDAFNSEKVRVALDQMHARSAAGWRRI